jgi:CRP-like cAMP-binding protein
MTEEATAGRNSREDDSATLRQGELGNALLRALTPADYALLHPHLARVPFAVGDEVAVTGEPIEWVRFPEAGIAGILDSAEGDRRLAIGLVGREGMLGWPLLLGEERWPHDVAMRAEAGTSLRIAASALIAAVERSATLRQTLLRFAHVFALQVGQSVCSALIHPVDRRMARWILLYHDRVSGDEIFLTHEEFRLMLGVRRSSVTDALHKLEAERAVRALRGRVIVRDRIRLLELASDTYGKPEQAYRRLIEGDADETREGTDRGGSALGKAIRSVLHLGDGAAAP